MSKWSRSDIEKLVGKGKMSVSGSGLFPEKKKNPENKIPPPVPEGKKHIELILYGLKLGFKKEKYFVPGRDFRADYYVPSLNLLIEYEGIYSEKSQIGRAHV